MHGVTEVCPECQFDPAAQPDAEFADRFATFAKRFPIPLTRLLPSDNPAIVSTRPNPDTWSAIEYVGHVTGICETTNGWLKQLQETGTFTVEITDVDAEVVAKQFNSVAATDMAERVAAAATNVSETLRAVGAESLHKNASYEGNQVPVRLVIVAMVHECHHHLLDIGRVLRGLRQSQSQP